jgi:hypothetical protein
MLKNYSNKSKRHQTEEVKPARSIELKQAAQRHREREREIHVADIPSPHVSS